MKARNAKICCAEAARFADTVSGERPKHAGVRPGSALGRPASFGAYNLGATSSMQVYDWEGAVESCELVLRDDPDHLGALETLAQAQWFCGHYQAVIATTTRLLRLNPSEPGYRYTRGMAHLSRGELSRAREDFVAAISQSQDEGFRRQVGHSLAAVEQWMMDLAPQRSRFGQPFTSNLGRIS